MFLEKISKLLTNYTYPGRKMQKKNSLFFHFKLIVLQQMCSVLLILHSTFCHWVCTTTAVCVFMHNYTLAVLIGRKKTFLQKLNRARYSIVVLAEQQGRRHISIASSNGKKQRWWLAPEGFFKKKKKVILKWRQNNKSTK